MFARLLQKRCKPLMVGDDVITSAGIQSQITACIHITSIGRFLRACALYSN